MRYIALLDGTPSAYGVSFPDCPGCAAMGDTNDEALQHAILALADWLRLCQEEGVAVPSPRSYDTLLEDDEVRQAVREGGALIAIPYIPEVASGTTSINISIDRELLKAIDETADAIGLTRSAFLAAAARDKIHASV